MTEKYIIKTVDIPDSVQYLDLNPAYWNKEEHLELLKSNVGARQWSRNPKYVYQFDTYEDAVAVVAYLGTDIYIIEKYIII